jgi:dimethylhistidine N-methyltransferase
VGSTSPSLCAEDRQLKHDSPDAQAIRADHRNGGADDGFARAVLSGLDRSPRVIPPKYLYDAAGSVWFDRICDLPEYYPTRTEAAILSTHAEEIAALMGPHAELIEFGAGSLTKVRTLFDAFDAADRPRRYLPIDLSGEHLERAAARLHTHYPHVAVQPVIADYTQSFELPAPLPGTGRRVGFFPGSTIGNLEPAEMLQFLQRAAELLRGGGLLVGVDLVKDPARLHAAYNDRDGVTAAFNLNLLRRINDELDGDIDLQAFAHYAFYDLRRCRVEMHLVSRRAQVLQVAGRAFRLGAGNSIHTENSHKFSIEGFQRVAMAADFRPGPAWVDRERLFSVHWLEAPGGADGWHAVCA